MFFCVCPRDVRASFRCPRCRWSACRTVHDSPLEGVAHLVIVLAILLAAAKVGAELVERFLVG